MSATAALLSGIKAALRSRGGRQRLAVRCLRLFSAAQGRRRQLSRREMIRMLLHKPRRAGELAQTVAMSPQALSRVAGRDS